METSGYPRQGGRGPAVFSWRTGTFWRIDQAPASLRVNTCVGDRQMEEGLPLITKTDAGSMELSAAATV